MLILELFSYRKYISKDHVEYTNTICSTFFYQGQGESLLPSLCYLIYQFYCCCKIECPNKIKMGNHNGCPQIRRRY